MNLVCCQLPYFTITPTTSSWWLSFMTASLRHALTQPCPLHKCQMIRTLNKCLNVLSIFIYAVTCAWSLCIPTCAKCVYINIAVLSSLPPSDSLSLSSDYWSFMFPCLHYSWAPGDSNNHCTIFALWLVTIHVCLRHTTLGCSEHFHTNVEARFVMSM